MAELHEAEVYHADFSPGNVLYDRTEEGVRFSLIDINRMYFGPVSLNEDARISPACGDGKPLFI